MEKGIYGVARQGRFWKVIRLDDKRQSAIFGLRETREEAEQDMRELEEEGL